MADLKKYEGIKAVAVYTMSNFGGVEILEIIHGIEDAVIWRYNKEIGLSKIECGYEGEPYFIVGEIKIYLADCMRVG